MALFELSLYSILKMHFLNNLNLEAYKVYLKEHIAKNILIFITKLKCKIKKKVITTKIDNMILPFLIIIFIFEIKKN
jgi:hypothetical protein